MKNYKYRHYGLLWLLSCFLVACGGSGGGSEQPADRTPEHFSFSPVADAELASWVESDSVVISGFGGSVSISMDSGEYSVDGTEFTSAAGTISSGERLTLRVYSSAHYGSTVTAEVDVGGVTSTFSVETRSEDMPPSISIDFPDQDDYLTYSDEVLVIGSASDNDAVASILVNGVEAISDDGFQTWKVILPIEEPGDFRIDAIAQDHSGNSASAKSGVIARSIHDPLNCHAGVYASASDTLYFHEWPYIKSWNLASEEIHYVDFDAHFYAQVFDDTNYRSFGVDNDGDLYSANPDGGELTLISPEGESGILFADSNLSELGLDTNTGMLYGVANTGSLSIVSIDPQTGRRAIVSHSEQWGEDGMPFGELEIGDGELYYMDTGVSPSGVYRVEISSGARTLISEPGSATIYDNGFVVDGTNKTGYFIVRGDIVKMDLTDGSRTVLSPAEDWVSQNYLTTTFASPNMASRVMFDTLRNRIIVQSCASDDIFSIDATTGERIKLTSDRRGEGADLTRAESLVYSPSSDSLFLTTETGLVEIDKKSGDRRFLPIAGLNIGARNLIANPAGDKFYAVNDNQILEISPLNGTSRVVTNTRVGEGPTIGWARAVAVDEARNRLLIVDYRDDAVVAVDLDSGTKTVLASAEQSPEGGLVNPSAIAMDPDSDRIFVVAENRLLEIDPVSGEPTTLFEPEEGDGYSISGVSRIVVDPRANRILVSGNYDVFMEMDLETGVSAFSELTGGGEAISNFTVDSSSGYIYSAGDKVLFIDRDLQGHFVLSH